MSVDRPSAVIIDDATVIRQSFPAVMPELEIAATFATADQFISSGVRVDLVILELQRVDKCPIEVRRGLDSLRLAVAEGHRVCSYTQEARPFVHAACLAAGARGVVSKGDPLPVAQQLFLDVARGQTIITADLITAFDLLPKRRQLAVLTARQRSILNARARRLTFAETAEKLDLDASVVLTEWRKASAALGEHLRGADLELVTGQLELDPAGLADIWPVAPSDGPRTRVRTETGTRSRRIAE